MEEENELVAEYDDIEGENLYDYAQVFTRSYIRRSRSRYRAVHRRQMDALFRRTAWFLDIPGTATNITAPQVVVTFDRSSSPYAIDTSIFAPTSTQSLVDIDCPLQHSNCLVTKEEGETKSSSRGPKVVLARMGGEGCGTIFLSALPSVSMMSIRSAPTCQASPETYTRCDDDYDDCVRVD